APAAASPWPGSRPFRRRPGWAFAWPSPWRAGWQSSSWSAWCFSPAAAPDSAGGGNGMGIRVVRIIREGAPKKGAGPMRSLVWIGVVVYWAPLASGGEEPAKPPWLVNAPIATVKKELYKRSPRPGAAALAAVFYVGPQRERLEWQGVEVTDDVHDKQVV